MLHLMTKVAGYAGAFLASLVVAFSVGCASGGFKLTREYARFVNKQHIIVRIIIYLLTTIVFAVTLLVDMVIFNTMDFWQGRVSAGEFKFSEGEKTFHVRHEILPGAPLKRSTIEVFNPEKSLLQTVVLQETTGGEIELFVDGVLRGKVRDLEGLPLASVYDAKGEWQNDRMILGEALTPALKSASR